MTCDLAQCGLMLGQTGLAMIVLASLALIAAALYFGMCNCPPIIVRVTLTSLMADNNPLLATSVLQL